MKKAIPIAVVLIGLGTYVYFYHVKPAREYDPTVRGFGTVEVTDVVVSPKIPARIASITVQEGDPVADGQVLVTLSCSDLQARLVQGQAQVKQAELKVVQALASRNQAAAAKKYANASVRPYLVSKERADREYKRALALVQQNSISKKAVDEAKTELEAAQERIAAAKQSAIVSRQAVKVADQGVNLAQSQVEAVRAGLDIIRSQLEECTLKSPIAGKVLRRNYEPGEMSLPGAALLKLANLGEVHTWIYVPNEEIGRVRLGQRAEVVADAYPGQVFTGTVVRINEEAEFTPKSIQTKEDRTQLVYGVKVALDNEKGDLMAGMPVEASLVEGSAPEPGSASPKKSSQTANATPKAL